MLDIFFYGGSFMKPVTDVNVHEHLGYWNEERKPVLSKPIVHPREEGKTEIAADLLGGGFGKRAAGNLRAGLICSWLQRQI